MSRLIPQNAQQRYEREKDYLLKLKNQVNVPEIISFEDEKKEIKMKRYNFTTLQSYLQNPSLENSIKEDYILQAVNVLKKIHDVEDRVHGDAYTNNFALDNEIMYALDFDNHRSHPNPKTLDLIMLCADSIYLSKFNLEEQRQLLEKVKERYGEIKPIKFALRDKAFYKLTFNSNSEFFDFFNKKT
ncbi:hypothetical protein HOA56_05715 [archaeon]|nr:hypothetical protein [archaeon]